MPLPDIWREAINNWTEWLVAQGFPRTTIELRVYHLTLLARENGTLRPWELTLHDLVAWFARHDRWGGDYRRSVRSSVRKFYAWGIETELTLKDPTRYLRTPRPKRPVPRPTPEWLINEALLHAAERERLMILLAACCSMRRGEITMFHTDWIEGDEIRIRGKGARQRLVPIPEIVAVELAKLHPGYVFPRPGVDEPMTPAHVGKLISRALGPGYTGHTLRHRFSTKAYAAERDLVAVQELLGHSSIETTRIYTAVPDGAKRRAAAAADIHAA
ncbi:tyrosine-type recombinase/integrase [Jatrophihabitans sp. DSM 45814]